MVGAAASIATMWSLSASVRMAQPGSSSGSAGLAMQRSLWSAKLTSSQARMPPAPFAGALEQDRSAGVAQRERRQLRAGVAGHVARRGAADVRDELAGRPPCRGGSRRGG